MAEKRKISKEKGVRISVDMLYAGGAPKDIIKFFTENYGVSIRTVEHWIKAARPEAAEKQSFDDKIRKKELDKAVADTVTAFSITKERNLQRLAQIAYGDIRGIFNEDSTLKPISEWTDEATALIANVETFEVKDKAGNKLGDVNKVKNHDPLAAIAMINKMLGYDAPAKMAQTDPDGNAVTLTPTFVFTQMQATDGVTTDTAEA